MKILRQTIQRPWSVRGYCLKGYRITVVAGNETDASVVVPALNEDITSQDGLGGSEDEKEDGGELGHCFLKDGI